MFREHSCKGVGHPPGPHSGVVCFSMLVLRVLQRKRLLRELTGRLAAGALLIALLALLGCVEDPTGLPPSSLSFVSLTLGSALLPGSVGFWLYQV